MLHDGGLILSATHRTSSCRWPNLQPSLSLHWVRGRIHGGIALAVASFWACLREHDSPRAFALLAAESTTICNGVNPGPGAQFTSVQVMGSLGIMHERAWHAVLENPGSSRMMPCWGSFGVLEMFAANGSRDRAVPGWIIRSLCRRQLSVGMQASCTILPSLSSVF